MHINDEILASLILVTSLFYQCLMDKISTRLVRCHDDCSQWNKVYDACPGSSKETWDPTRSIRMN